MSRLPDLSTGGMAELFSEINNNNDEPAMSGGISALPGIGKSGSELSSISPEHFLPAVGEENRRSYSTTAGREKEPSAAAAEEAPKKPRKKFKCDKCGKVCDSSAKLTRHYTTHTGVKDFKCLVKGCGKAFSLKQHLLQHNVVHIPKDKVVKPFACKETGCSFSTACPRNFRNHAMIHTGEKPFKCLIGNCGAAYRQKKDLQQHVFKHEGTDPELKFAKIRLKLKTFVCKREGCTYTTNATQDMKKHEIAHSGIRRFKCDFAGCHKKFALNAKLIRHRRNHTGEKPYSCTVAGCTFASAYLERLKHHTVLNHSEGLEVGRKLPQTVKCDYKDCTFSTDFPGNMTIHKRETVQVPGERCEKAYSCRGSLVAHSKHSHTEISGSVGPFVCRGKNGHNRRLYKGDRDPDEENNAEVIDDPDYNQETGKFADFMISIRVTQSGDSELPDTAGDFQRCYSVDFDKYTSGCAVPLPAELLPNYLDSIFG
ncbi:putative Zinc finger protein 287 [Hypsibius exemplaris]|uniref:Zinc finger protein 287 n=1 Tax=Hypsibius exemplaris TaxID=2072580 RepID=A0A1W0WUX4_HYPEX|nr:putative Zinc finger protein 287 [Hypsibius exemplaris]